MVYVITSIGVLLLVVAVVGLVQPQRIKQFLIWAKEGKRCYMGGVIRILFGALLIIAAPRAHFPYIPMVIGIIMLLAGIAFFVIGLGRIHRMIDWWLEKADNAMRAGLAVVALIGLLLIYSL